MDHDQLIHTYFRLGFSQSEILECLATQHRIVVSRRSLQRILKAQRLYRRKDKTDVLTVAMFITEEFQKTGKMNGYRWMHARCLHRGLVVTQDTVRLLLHILDPVGIEVRKARRLRRRKYYSKGPNFCWHVDGYDKLSPYGICIHGCIDGFSRYLIWLQAATTNHNPRVISGYFMNAVTKQGGCPRRIRADRGTENVGIERLQEFLRRNHEDSLAKACFLYGQSVSNQRIEAFWGILRKECTQSWMNVFSALKDHGFFSGDFLDKSLVQFCFLKLVQEDLNEVILTWNSHRIRPYRNMLLPSGRPFLLYNTPGVYGSQDHITAVDMLEVEACLEECTPKSDIPCDGRVFNLCCILMLENGLGAPSNVLEAADLYCSLRDILHAELHYH